MMEAKDWMSGLLGAAVFLLGLLPLLESLKIIKTGVSGILQANWFVAAIPYVLAILGFYLAIESIIELTNSNHIGWTSFLIGSIVMLLGLLTVLQGFGIGPGLFGIVLSPIVYQIIFMVEGFFLMIAMFAMEL